MNSLKTTTLGFILAIGFALMLGGCGNPAQKRAYEAAAKKEQSVSIENAPALIAEYKQIVRMKPGSAWAEKAEARIKAIEARVKAEEMRKEVFQEHGID